MPWKVSSEMDKRLRFIARLFEGEAMTDLCVEFAIGKMASNDRCDDHHEKKTLQPIDNPYGPGLSPMS